MRLLEKRLTKYRRLLKEYDWDEEDDYFKPDFDDEDSAEELETDDTEDIADDESDEDIPSTHSDNRGYDPDTVYKFDDYEEDDDYFKFDGDDDEDVNNWQDTASEPKKKEYDYRPPQKPKKKYPVKVDKNHISLEDELMNDVDAPDYNKPTVSLKIFQKAVRMHRLTSAEFRNPYYNELFSKSVPGVYMDKNGRIYVSFSFRTPDDIDNEKFGTGIIIRKNTLAEVFTTLFILLHVVDEYYGSIFIGDYDSLFDFYTEYILMEDDDEMEIVDVIIRKLREVKITDIYEIKNFVEWYNSKKDEYSAKYYDKNPEVKKARHSRTKKIRQLFRRYDVKKDKMQASKDKRYIDIMGNIVHAMDYDEDKCSEYVPPRKMKAVDLMKLYVAGLILMERDMPQTVDGLDDMPVFRHFAEMAMKKGISWEDIVKEYRKY